MLQTYQLKPLQCYAIIRIQNERGREFHTAVLYADYTYGFSGSYSEQMQIYQLTGAWTKGTKFANDVFNCIYLNSNYRISLRISLHFAA